MKPKLNNILFLALLVGGLLLYNACDNDGDYELGTPFSQVEGINGSWTLVQVEQFDEVLGDEDAQLDVSALMIGSQPAEVSFQSGDRSFSVTPGSTKVFFPQDGSWAFDNEEFPERLQLTKDGSMTDLKLEAPVRANVDDFLIFRYTRPIADCVELEDGKLGAISYIYKFERQ